jgi:DNA repair protein RecN (Recombination protein N)
VGSLAARLEAAAIELTDIADELLRREAAPDPETLAAMRERLALLAHLKRKYGDDEVRVLEYLERARARQLELETLDSDLESLQEEAAKLTTEAQENGGRLSDIRRAAAMDLQERMIELLETLALKGARFEVGFEERDLYEGGLEQIEFKVAVNPGEGPRPVAKVASGGELSRIALALHLLTASGATTMVFDEIDAGVGGESAQSIGRALADLARRSEDQVVVVTHLPQVAAFANHHLRVTKSIVGGRSSALVEPIGGGERVVELSRMLAGLPGSDSAQEHAQELLKLAQSGRTRAKAGRR